MKIMLLKLWYIFREHTRYNLLFTMIGGYFYFTYGNSSIAYIIWMKIISFPVISFWWFHARGRFLYFFHNLGFSTKKLLIYAIAMDWILTFCILFTLNIIRA